MASFVGNGMPYQIVTGTADGTIRHWQISTVPLQQSVDKIKLWLQVRTGMEIEEATGEIQSLTTEEWQARRQKLEATQDSPEPGVTAAL